MIGSYLMRAAQILRVARPTARGFIAACALLALAALGATAQAAVGINKSFTPNSVTAGVVSTLTIVLINPNAAAATGVSVTDTLPANVVVANPLTVGTNTCGFTVTATPGLSPIALSGGTIPGIAGGVPGQCSLSINVVSSIPNTYLNIIPASAVSSSQGTNPQSAQATLVVSAPANITGVKAFVPVNVHGNGTPSTLTITLTNPNAVALTNAAITDPLPAAITIATPSNAATTCGAGVATASAPASNPATIVLTGGTIPANGSCTITVQVIARNPNAFVNGNQTNTIPAGALTTTQGATSPAIQANINVQTGAQIVKSFSPNPLPAGGAASTMTLTINNFNNSILTPITFTDTWAAAGMSVSGVPATTCGGALTNTANSVTLNGGSLGPAPSPGAGATSCTITVPVTATATTVNNIAAGNFGGVAYPAASGTLTVSTITGSKAFSAPAVQTATVTMTITLNNISAVPVTITTITDNLNTMGAGFTVPASAVPGGTCGSTLTSPTPGTLITLTGGTISANGSCTITLPVAISATAPSGNRTNTIAVNGVNTTGGNNTSTITGTVNILRALNAAKAFVPANVQAGAKSRLTVTLTRTGGAVALTNIAFADNLATMGAGFVVASPANAATTCTGGAVTATPGAPGFSFAGGSLAGGAANTSCTVALDVQTPAGATVGNHTNSIPAASITTAEGATGGDTSAILVISAPTSVTVNKSFSPTTVAVNGTSVMSIQIRNNNAGAIALTGVGLTDNLPAGMVVANPPLPTFAGTGCSGAVITAANNTNTVALASANVGLNSICTLAVTVRALVSGNLINTIPAGAVSSSQGVTNPLIGSATLAAIGSVNLNVTKTDGVLSVTPGGATTYTIVVSNSGPNSVAGVGVTDTPPAFVTFGAWACVPAGGAFCGSGSGPINDVVDIPVGGSITYSVPATIAANAVGSITNTVNLAVPGSVINTGISSASDTDTLVPVTSLAITKSDGSLTYQPGLGATYVMVLTNAGPSDASNVTLTDTFPAGVTQSAGLSCVAVGPGANCGTVTNSGTGFGVTGAYVPAAGGSSVTYSQPVNFAANMTAPSITNTVNATNLASAGPGSTASASDTDTLLLFGPTLGKSIVPGTIPAGGASTLTLALGNSNAAPIALTAAFIDNMPAGVTITGAGTITCVGVTTTPTSITMASGSIIPAGGCSISVPITSSTPGTVTNTTGTLSTSSGNAPPASAPLTVTAIAPTLGKSIVPASIAVGGTSTLTLTLGNPNAVAIALSAAFTDAMPPGVTTVGGNTGTCAGVTVLPGSISMAAGTTIPPGSCTIVVTITSSTPGTVTNTTGTLTTVAGNAGPAAADLTVTALPTLAKTIVPATIAIGGSSTLTLTIGNTNPTPITLTAALTDAMPAGVTTTGPNVGTCAGVTVAAGSVDMALGSVVPAGGCTIVVPITSSTPGTVTNTTGTLSTSSGNAPSASAPLTVTAVAPTLGKSIVPATISMGGSATLTLTLGNSNTVAITLSSAFADAMPAGVTTVGGNTGTCAGAVVAATSLSMAAGSTIPVGGCTIIVSITSTTPGTVTNTTGTLATNAGNAAPAAADLTVNAPPTLAKTIVPATIAIGGSATLTITIGNTNPTPITLTAALTDAMPAGVTTTGANTGTCPGVTVAAGSIGMASGSVVPAGGCTIIVPVTSNTPGTVTNITGSLDTTTGSAVPAQAPLTVTAVSSALGKTIVPATITAGGTATLTITLANANAVPITLSAPFTDSMPSGVTTTGANSGTCIGITVTATTITMTSGTAIPVGGCTIVVPVTSNTPGTVTNTTGTLATNAGSTPPGSAPLTVTPAVSVVTKTIVPGTIALGGTATLTISLSNINTTDLTLTAPFTDAMPAGVTISGANSGTCAGVATTATNITMASGSIIPPGGCTIIVPITSSTPGTVVNTTSGLTTNAGTAPSASATLIVTATTAGLAKSIAPATIAIGGAATLTITLANTNAVAITLTGPFVDTMPAGVTITSGNTGTCPGVTTGATAISMAVGTTIPPGGCTIVVTITSSTPGTVTNTTSTLQTNVGTAPAASAPLTVTGPGAGLAKTIAPATIAVGGTATLTLTLANTSPTALTLAAAFTDPMPAGVTTTSGNTGTCAGVTVTAALITMATGSTVPPGGCTIVVTITSSTPGTVTNVTSTLLTSAGTTPAASAPLTVTTSGASLAKTIVPATIAVGGSATLTLTLGNANATPLTLAAAFTDPMPAGVTTTSGNTGTCAGVTVAPTLITMAAGSTIPPGGCTIVVTITSSTPGTVTNVTSTLQLSGGGTAPAASAPLTVTSGTSAVTKTIAPAIIAAGGTATLTITLANTGGVSLTLAAAFTDPMPAGVTTTSGNTGTCTGVTVTPVLITMAAGSTIPPGGCTIVVTITSSTPGTVTNITSPLQTSGGGTAPAASAPITVTGGASASITKTIAPSIIMAGGTATLTIALTNPNPTPLVLTAPFTDPMPAGMTIASGNTGTCPGVTVTPTLITMASGSAIPPGGCTIVVTITSSTMGSVTNITSALQAGSTTAPAASAPFAVAAPFNPAEPIPATTPLGLAILLAVVTLFAALQLRRRARIDPRRR